jgi:hypothetical protein
MLLMECDDADSPLGEVYIYMVEEDIPEQQAAENLPATRAEGDPAEGEGAGSDGTEGEGNATVVDGAYGVFAYQGSGNIPATYTPGEGVVPFQDIQNLSLNSLGKYVGQDDGKEIYAPGAGTWLYFFAYGPHMTITQSGQTANPALRENSQYPYLEYTATTDLAKTTDLIFGGTPKPISGEVNETVGLNVSHILSKIRIHTGTIASGKITSLSLKGIKNAGTYNLGNNGMWTLSGATETYAKTAAEGNVSFDDLYLMPQEFTDDAKLEIKVEVPVPNSVPAQTRKYTLTKNLKALVGQWAPNKQYTYTISTPNEVEVTVSDRIYYEGTYPVKTDLVIKNNGLADAYIRVAIAGAWVVEEGTGTDAVQYTVSDWKNTGDPANDDGIFNWGAAQPAKNNTNTRHWRLGDDGYYYYMKSVVPGETIEPLFDSYKLTASSPVGGSYLAFTIIAQGVYLADAQHLFPADIWAELSK